MSRSSSPASKPIANGGGAGLTVDVSANHLISSGGSSSLTSSSTSRPATAGEGTCSTNMTLRAIRAKTVFISYCNEPAVKSDPSIPPNYAAIESAMVLKKHFLKAGYTVIDHDGSPFKDCRLNEIDQTAQDDLDRCVVFVACITREYHRNANCKAICRKANEKITRERGKPFEVCFVMMQGDYTILSDDSYRIKGWLYHLMKDALSYCGWSPSHLSAACEAIVGMSTLITKEFDAETGENRSKMLEWKADIARKYPYMKLPKLPPPKPLSTALLTASPNATLSPVKLTGKKASNHKLLSHGNSHGSIGSRGKSPDTSNKKNKKEGGTSSAGHTPANALKTQEGSFFATEADVDEDYAFEEN